MLASVLLAQCIYLAKIGHTKAEIRQRISAAGIPIFSIQAYRDKKLFSTNARDTIGPALSAALNSESFEDAMFKCIEIGGDTDTICCMCGGLAEALFGISPEISEATLQFLDEEMKGVISDLYGKSGYKTIGIQLRKSEITPIEKSPKSFIGRFLTFWTKSN